MASESEWGVTGGGGAGLESGAGGGAGLESGAGGGAGLESGAGGGAGPGVVAGDGAERRGGGGDGPDDDVALAGAPTFEEAHFRQVLGHFATGITVVTTRDDEGPVGFTCQSFMSVSLDPPLIVFSPAKTSTTWPRIEKAERFVINILSDKQEDICRVFATKGGDKFSGIGWRAGRTGAPILNDVLGWIEARMADVHEAGDHLLVTGRVVDLGIGESGHPLLFYRGGFGRFEA